MENVSIHLPSSWSELNLSQLQYLYKLSVANADASGNTSTSHSIKNSLEVICYLAEEDEAYVKQNLTVHNFYKVSEALEWVKSYPEAEDRFEAIRKGYEFSGKTYCLNLLDDITAHEYAEIYNYMERGKIEYLHLILAILFRPTQGLEELQDKIAIHKPEEFNIESVEARAKLFLNLPSDVAFQLSFFFSMSWNLYQLTSPTSILETKTEITKLDQMRFGFYPTLWSEAERRNGAPDCCYKDNLFDLLFFLQNRVMENRIQKELNKEKEK